MIGPMAQNKLRNPDQAKGRTRLVTKRNEFGRVVSYQPGNKLTTTTAMLVLSALRRGSTRQAAAAMAGVSYNAFCNWLDHRRVPLDVVLPNMRDENGAPIDYSGMPFHEAVTRCQQEAADYLQTRIMAAASEGYKETFHYGRNGALLRSVKEFDWKAAAWLLEHNPEFRKDWASPTRMELTGANGGPIRAEGVNIVTWAPDADWLQNYAKALNEVEGTATEVPIPPSLGPGDDDEE